MPEPPSGRAPSSASFLQARLRRDFAAVEELGRRILAANPADEITRRALARQYDERALDDDALAHWQAIRDLSPADFEAAFHVARALARSGSSSDEAAARVAPGACFRRNLREVLEEDHGDPPRETELRNVVICGVSYCGSTLMDRVLGGLPGAASIGESHWLIRTQTAQGYGTPDFASEAPGKWIACSGCGSKCGVLSSAFRRRLAADHRKWFYRVARQLGTSTLISADKNPPKIVDHDPLLRFGALVMFKSPAQAWASELRKKKPGEPGALEECRKYIGAWCRSYRTFLDDFAPAGGAVFLSFEDFASRPRQVLERVAKSLSLEFDAGVLASTRPGHAIGGNANAIRKLRLSAYAPGIVPLEEPDLPESHRKLVEESAEAQHLFERLTAAHRHMMERSTQDRPDE